MYVFKLVIGNSINQVGPEKFTKYLLFKAARWLNFFTNQFLCTIPVCTMWIIKPVTSQDQMWCLPGTRYRKRIFKKVSGIWVKSVDRNKSFHLQQYQCVYNIKWKKQSTRSCHFILSCLVRDGITSPYWDLFLLQEYEAIATAKALTRNPLRVT